jgi:hypothetical protein
MLSSIDDKFTKWKEGPITELVMKYLDMMIEITNNELLESDTLLGSVENRARLVGRREALENFKSISVEDIERVLDEDQSYRTVSSSAETSF